MRRSENLGNKIKWILREANVSARNAVNFPKRAAVLSCALGMLSVAGFSQQSTRGQLSTPEKQSSKTEILQKISSWTADPTFGWRESADVDTLMLNYSMRSVPAMMTDAYATTGNYGAEGYNLLWAERSDYSDFFFRDAISIWLPYRNGTVFYNSHLPMTLLSYNFGGSKDTSQDHLNGIFSGNINSRAQIGAYLDYIYSKGSYNYQADKDLTWGFSGSYLGDRYQFQGSYYHYNFLNKENGGITDDLFITDPAEIQGGSTSVDYKTIPTRLTAAHSRVAGGQLWLNNRYNLGFTRRVEAGDSVVEEFVPVTGIIWTLDYQNARHTFIDTNAAENEAFWSHSYFSTKKSDDRTSYAQLRNTLAVELCEGFNKYVPASLTAFAQFDYLHYKFMADTIDRTIELSQGLSPLPIAAPNPSHHESQAWVGAVLARRNGKILNYYGSARFGIAGKSLGEVNLEGRIDTRIPIFSDSINVEAFAKFDNSSTPCLLEHYLSNHFAWDNDFGNWQRLRLGGVIAVPQTATKLSIAAENLTNPVYFNEKALPTKYDGSVRLFSASLWQNFKFGPINWHNRLTYQTSSNVTVMPMPKFVAYTNLYFLFKVARVLDVQLGVDCDYYTRYKAVAYQPATMVFYNQNEVECGNFPLMNVYINMKLSRTRFYVMFSHFNQGMTGSNWFSMPHYPINPRRFQLGLSVDFAN